MPETLGPVDWVIDVAANPSVLAGVDGKSSSRQLLEHNLFGTINLLEFCKRVGAGFLLLSTSRVYSIEPLTNLKMSLNGKRFSPAADQQWPCGVSVNGVTENGPAYPPVSLYGASKLASETLALEYAHTFDMPVWINRCGVLAGAGQFGRADQRDESPDRPLSQYFRAGGELERRQGEGSGGRMPKSRNGLDRGRGRDLGRREKDPVLPLHRRMSRGDSAADAVGFYGAC
jgi:nucleoside-diphosphate-sugar epimerase